jgi:hypothetical protein
MRGLVRRLASLLATVAVLSLGLAVAGATSATAAATWSAPTDIDGSNHLDSVSCPSTSFCVAVDAEGDALNYNGSSWSSPSLIGGTDAVSCPSVTFCAAVGPNDFLTYHGTTWSTPTIIGMVDVDSVSCSSASFCVAVDQNGDAFTYNGLSWSSPVSINAPYGDLESVSCSSASFCVALDVDDDAFIYNGFSWTKTPNVSAQWISCPTINFCVGVDTSGHATTYNGTSWSSPTPIDVEPYFTLTSVSCANASFCVAVDQQGYAVTYNGSAWSSPSRIESAQPFTLESVSCASASFCVAVDPDGNALTYASSSTPPTVTSVNPSKGPTTGGTAITINGTGFVTGASVVIGQGNGAARGIAATNVVVVSPTEITADTGGVAVAGVFNVYVNTSGGTSAPDSGDLFDYFVPVPTVTSVTPNRGPTTGYTAITVNGTGFLRGASVAIGQGSGSVGAIAASGVIVVSTTEITAAFTGQASKAGVFNVYVTTSGGTSTAESGDLFDYFIPVPNVGSVTPNRGPTTGSTAIHINGTGFIPGATVVIGQGSGSLGGIAASNVVVVNSTTITAVTGGGAKAGAFNVYVTTSGGSSVPNSGDLFAYT